MIILGTFTIIKIINFRLHKSLDTNPEEDESEEVEGSEGEQEDEGPAGEEKGAPDDEKKEEEKREARDGKELEVDGQIDDALQTKAQEAGLPLPGQVPQESELEGEMKSVEESLQRHRDSASSLGHSSQNQSSPEEVTAELQPSGGGGGRKGESSLLVSIDTAMEVRGEKKVESSLNEDEHPLLVPYCASSSTEPALKPINEEPQLLLQKSKEK